MVTIIAALVALVLGGIVGYFIFRAAAQLSHSAE